MPPLDELWKIIRKSPYLDPAKVSVSQVRVRAVDPHNPTPYVQQWSFGVQREIGRDFVAEADYVGTKSTHLDVLWDYIDASKARQRRTRTSFTSNTPRNRKRRLPRAGDVA